MARFGRNTESGLFLPVPPSFRFSARERTYRRPDGTLVREWTDETGTVTTVETGDTLGATVRPDPATFPASVPRRRPTDARFGRRTRARQPRSH